MRQFDPTRPPTGRLARLGVLIDPSRPDHQGIARFCDLAGIDIVWLATGDGGVAPERWTAAEALAGSLRRARLGVVVDGSDGPPGSAVTEIAFEDASGPHDPAGSFRAGRDAAPRISIAIDDEARIGPLLAAADDIVLPAWAFDDLETAADEIRAEAAEGGRDPATLGVAVTIPVSIGRTGAEAAARADMDPAFVGRGHPRDIGIFGTLEECQDRVIALAHAGVTDLRCTLPAVPDIHDVIAQLTAMTVGTTDVLIPGSLRSPAPPPPEGWGGRPDTPPRQGVSGGSRRR
jgi:alkanesulfonate monooxygenase SsuD/methylene tetrahydromethanopterin reductase-like flavin-dependent oxidoreductase (luciferase family)